MATQVITLLVPIEKGDRPAQEWNWNMLLDTAEDVVVLAAGPIVPEAE